MDARLRAANSRLDSPPAFVPREHHIELASGRYLDLSDPNPDDITLEDVAHGLALTCRFAGQARRFYSVAEHAALVSWRLAQQGFSPAVQFAGLHHDDSEAFIGDVTRPLKALLPAYRGLEKSVGLAIAAAIGPREVSEGAEALVRLADDWALSAEAWQLLPSKGETWHVAGLFNPEEDGVGRLGVEWHIAGGNFIHRHNMLSELLELTEAG